MAVFRTNPLVRPAADRDGGEPMERSRDEGLLGKEGGGVIPSRSACGPLTTLALVDLWNTYGDDAEDVITWVLAKKEVILNELKPYRQ